MDSKRTILINTALHLFYEKGINSVGINEVLKVSGIAKKTLYHHFSSKEALVLAALEQRHNCFLTWLEHELGHQKGDIEVVKTLFMALTKWFSNSVPELGNFRGCFFINTSAELGHSNTMISKYCQYHKQQVSALIAGYLTQSSESLLDAISLLKEGAITTAYVTGDVNAAQKCLPLLASLYK